MSNKKTVLEATVRDPYARSIVKGTVSVKNESAHAI